ncbi:MAG: SIS domain-containing protein [Bacteroidetes bacterium]|nr:SIS domain-containing protein [Bacteroidota bacterium]MBU1797647.1 SIS domain-containing protein [Bacteroidota bacterium]
MESSFLGYSNSELINIGGFNTAKEIESQTTLWNETYLLIEKHKIEISNFVKDIYSQNNPTIILAGAGTSAYIGEVLESIFEKYTGINCKAVSTTSLVTHPKHYLHPKKPTLLISFARSGNSPESIKAVELANEVCENIYHLVITCDAKGELAKSISKENGYLFVLPEGTNDKSLAMTSSFTSMLLSGILVSRINEIEKLKSQISLLCNYAQNILKNNIFLLQEIAELNFERAVFLGSGLFEGIARESQLKLQELTSGKVICKHDTFLGFRHGPKAVINDKTLVVYLISNNPYVQKYEEDLIQSIHAENIALCTLAISEKDLEIIKADKKIVFTHLNPSLEEEFLAIVSTLPAQILGFYKSIKHGLQPDSPSENGAISRVVQGVKLYPYNQKNIVELGCF